MSSSETVITVFNIDLIAECIFAGHVFKLYPIKNIENFRNTNYAFNIIKYYIINNMYYKKIVRTVAMEARFLSLRSSEKITVKSVFNFKETMNFIPETIPSKVSEQYISLIHFKGI